MLGAVLLSSSLVIPALICTGKEHFSSLSTFHSWLLLISADALLHRCIGKSELYQAYA
jgi:hypothetical protein